MRGDVHQTMMPPNVDAKHMPALAQSFGVHAAACAAIRPRMDQWWERCDDSGNQTSRPV